MNLKGTLGVYVMLAVTFAAVMSLSAHADTGSQQQLQAQSLLSADSSGIIPSNANLNAEVNAAINGSGTQGQNITLQELGAAIGSDTPHGLGLFFTQLRYNFASNQDTKARLGLKIAQSHLLEAEKKFNGGDDKGAQEQMQKYMELQNQIALKYNQSSGSNSESSAESKFVLDKRMQINTMFTQQFQERINNSNLSEQQKQNILSAIDNALNKTKEANLAIINARQQVLTALNASGHNVSAARLEAKAEDRISSNYGDNRSAQVMIISTARLIVKADTLYGNYSNLNSTSTNDSARVLAKLNDAKAKLQIAKAQYDAGKFSAAKDEAMQARASAVVAYALMVSRSEDARLLVQARQEDNKALRIRIEDQVKQRISEREQQRLRNETENALNRLGTVNETLKERIQKEIRTGEGNNNPHKGPNTDSNDSAGADMNASAEDSGNSSDQGNSSDSSNSSGSNNSNGLMIKADAGASVSD